MRAKNIFGGNRSFVIWDEELRTFFFFLRSIRDEISIPISSIRIFLNYISLWIFYFDHCIYLTKYSREKHDKKIKNFATKIYLETMQMRLFIDSSRYLNRLQRLKVSIPLKAHNTENCEWSRGSLTYIFFPRNVYYFLRTHFARNRLSVACLEFGIS